MTRAGTIAQMLCGAALSLVVAIAAAQAPREVHGSADAYAAPGIALAWGVLRGATEGATTVVIRVIADPAQYGQVAARGKDPFSAQAEPLLAPTPSTRSVDIRVPRARFADLPRTEILLYAPGARAEAPAVIVYYLGVPDTTPELAGTAALDASLDERIARARANIGKTTP
jgi:hypothetical protein